MGGRQDFHRALFQVQSYKSRGPIPEPNDAFDDSDDWWGMMDRLSIDEETQSAIVDPRFKHIWLTRSCKHWAINTFFIRMKVLEGLKATSRARVWSLNNSRQRETQRAGRSERITLSLSPLAQVGADAVESLNTTILWKGMDWRQTSEDDELSGHLRLPVPGAHAMESDFFAPYVGDGMCLYASKALAEDHARYAALRCRGLSKPMLLRVSISTTFLHSFRPATLLYGDNWKGVIHACRAGKIRPRIKDLYWDDLIVGHVATNSDKAPEKFDSYQEIDETHFFKTDDGSGLKPVVQYLFRGGTRKIEESFKKNGVQMDALISD